MEDRMQLLSNEFPVADKVCAVPIEILDLHRTSMLAQVLKIFFGKEHLVKNWLISTLDKVIYFKGTNFQRSTKPLFTT
jgi:hypothetical protein